MAEGRRGGKKGRKIGRQVNKPAHKRYNARGQREANKQHAVHRSSHGLWTYVELREHTKQCGGAHNCKHYSKGPRAELEGRKAAKRLQDAQKR